MKGVNGGSHSHKEDKEKIERKHKVEKGVERLERHPADGLPLKHDPKKGHGGKYSWEGPYGLDSESETAVPAAMDQNDPNYVDDEDGDTNNSMDIEKDEVSGGGRVIGEVEAPAVAPTGVARIQVDPALKID